MAKAEATVTINKPISEVFAFLTTPENTPKWNPGFVEAINSMGGPVRVGTHVEQTMLGPGGRKIPADYEVTKLVPNQMYAFKVVAGPARPEGRYSFESVDGGTKVTFTLWHEPKGLLQKLFIGPMVAKQMPKEVAQIENLARAIGA